MQASAIARGLGPRPNPTLCARPGRRTRWARATIEHASARHRPERVSALVHDRLGQSPLMIEPPVSSLAHVSGEICRVMPTATAGEDTSLRLSSTAFGDGERIPKRHTCEGEDVSPPLIWAGAPEGTRSFAIVCEDPDAPIGVWRHWAVYDIPCEVGELKEDCPGKERIGAIRQAMNDFKHTGYGGPCPPPGDGTHRYRFSLFALDVDRLDLEEGARVRDVKKAVSCHALAEAVLIGTYSR